MAHVMCEDFAENRLKSPGSAEWPSITVAESTTKLAENRYRVRTYVDSQNAFGALIRTQVDCTLRVQDDEWTLENITLS
ncbi:hypothetical protein LCGC14_2667880 [marine sediment metagenome]|uniref:DUF3828 domain-containing protein n=1 Tax=marine sediment metagenome TaxID=412755 RepID=A0A0F8ZPY4_9ZZZZ